jgi:hypothetical protein
LRGHAPEPALWARELEIEVLSDRGAADWTRLRQLCTASEDHFTAFQRIADVLAAHGLHCKAEPVVRELLAQPGTNPSAGWLWVELRLRAGKLHNARHLLRLPQTELARRAFDRQLDGLGNALTQQQNFQFRYLRRPYLQFRRLWRARRDWFRQDDLLWGKVGYALSCAGRHQNAAAWLADWRQRKEVEPWMLDNLLIAYQETGCDAEAATLIEDARACPRHGGGFVRFDLFHALRAACAENPEPGRRLVALTMAEELDPYERSLYRFLRVALEFLPESGDLPAFDAERKGRLLQAYHATRRYRACRRVFRDVTSLISQRTGRRWPRWWARWHLLG